jgi:flagellar biosynthesis regulator FlbT
MFEMIKNSLLKLAKTIHKLYIDSHVKHITKVDESNIYYQTLKQLHAYYKTQNHTITFDVVKDKINSMEKHVLRKLLGWI